MKLKCDIELNEKTFSITRFSDPIEITRMTWKEKLKSWAYTFMKYMKPLDEVAAIFTIGDIIYYIGKVLLICIRFKSKFYIF